MNHAKHKAFPTRSKTRSGFTLVELVVVATILAILGAIGFGAYVSYIGTARDANRIAELSNIRAGLQGYMVHGDDLPLPSDYVTVYDGVDVLGYQGYAGQEVLNSIGLKKGGKDPSDGTYYTYYLTKSRNHFQLLGFLEEEENLPISAAIELIPSSYAVDYDERYPTVTGEKLGILVGTGSDLNKPIQEIESIISGGGNLDIAATGTEYTAIISDDYVVSGDNTVLSVVSALANSGGQIGKNCKDLITTNPGLAGKDGTYMISPPGASEPFEVDCDMTVDGGGWTRYTTAIRSTGIFDRIELGDNYISEAGELFFAYTREHTPDDWHAYKFKTFYTDHCSRVIGDIDDVDVGIKEYIDHITNETWGYCARSASTGTIETEKIIYGKYVDDLCLNGNLTAVNRATSWFGYDTPDGRRVGHFQNRISNTTVLMGTNGSASTRCASSVQSTKETEETYVYIR